MKVIRPRTLQDALVRLADDPDIRVVAGGTDLIPRLNQKFESCERLCLLGGYPEMTGVRYEANGRLFVGALVHLAAVGRQELLSPYTALLEAAGRAASPQIRNRATVGGNLLQENRCMYYNNQIPWSEAERCYKRGGAECLQYPGSRACMALLQSDLAPVMMAYGATARIAQLAEAGGGITYREMPVADLYGPAGRKNLEPGEILTGVLLPSREAGERCAYARWTIRGSFDFPLLSCAVDVRPESGTCGVVFGSAGVKPRRFEAGEAAFSGQPLNLLPDIAKDLRDQAAAVIMPFRDTHIDGEARRTAAGTLLMRVSEMLAADR